MISFRNVEARVDKVCVGSYGVVQVKQVITACSGPLCSFLTGFLQRAPPKKIGHRRYYQIQDLSQPDIYIPYISECMVLAHEAISAILWKSQSEHITGYNRLKINHTYEHVF